MPSSDIESRSIDERDRQTAPFNFIHKFRWSGMFVVSMIDFELRSSQGIDELDNISNRGDQGMMRHTEDFPLPSFPRTLVVRDIYRNSTQKNWINVRYKETWSIFRFFG